MRHRTPPGIRPGTLSPEIIGDIYTAAIDEERWPSLADLMARIAGVDSAGLWIAEDGLVTDMALTDNIRESQRPYLAHYVLHDHWQHGVLLQPKDEVKLGYENFPEQQLVKTEFYNDFARPLGMFRPLAAMVQLSKGAVASLALEQPFAR